MSLTRRKETETIHQLERATISQELHKYVDYDAVDQIELDRSRKRPVIAVHKHRILSSPLL